MVLPPRSSRLHPHPPCRNHQSFLFRILLILSFRQVPSGRIGKSDQRMAVSSDEYERRNGKRSENGEDRGG